MRNLDNLANTWSWMCVLLVMICGETRTGWIPRLHKRKVDPQVSLVETRMVTQEQPGQADSRRLILYKGSRSQDRRAIGRCKSLLLWSQVELKSIHFHHAKVAAYFLGHVMACEGWMQTGKLCWGHRPARPGLLEQDQGMVSCAAKARQPYQGMNGYVMFCLIFYINIFLFPESSKLDAEHCDFLGILHDCE